MDFLGLVDGLVITDIGSVILRESRLFGTFEDID